MRSLSFRQKRVPVPAPDIAPPKPAPRVPLVCRIGFHRWERSTESRRVCKIFEGKLQVGMTQFTHRTFRCNGCGRSVQESDGLDLFAGAGR